MVAPSISDGQLKDAVKAALVEVLEERADLLRDALAEVLEDIGLARAIQEGDTGERVSEAEVFKALDALR